MAREEGDFAARGETKPHARASDFARREMHVVRRRRGGKT